MDRLSLATASLRAAVRGQAPWFWVQAVTAVLAVTSMALAFAFAEHPWLSCLALFAIYLVIAGFLFVRRWYTKANALFARLQLHNERLEENARSHAGDLEDAKARYREINREHRREDEQKTRWAQVFQERATRHYERQLNVRDAKIEQLQAENAQLIEFVHQLQDGPRAAHDASTPPPGTE